MKISELIKLALQEDMPEGDITTDSMGIESRIGRAQLVAKEDLVLSGRSLFEATFTQLDPEIQIKWQFRDGDLILKGQTAASLKGNLVSIIKAERTALNFLGHLSGIATYTRCFVKALGESTTKILDTRKTMPLYRELEKRAVKDGGGTNHRLNLSDAIMIKENHIRLAGGVEKAVSQIRETLPMAITLECASKEEVQTAVRLQVGRILLDNMSDELMAECLKLIPGSIETEASGNMNLDRVSGLSKMGLNFISVGALTHSAPCADFSLLFDWSQAEPSAKETE